MRNLQKTEVTKAPKGKRSLPKRCPINTSRGKHFFLTIPHFDDLEQVFKILELKAKELLISKFAVVLETHTNDPNKANHLHVFVSFTKRREISLAFFDFLGKHGRLESVRSVEAVLQYMNKENVCKANFDVWESMLQRNFSRTVIIMMDRGWNQDEILLKYAPKLSGNKPWRSTFDLAVRYDAAKVDKEVKGEITRLRQISPTLIRSRLTAQELKYFDENPTFQSLVDVVNNLLKYGNQHPYKECCVAIVGPPSIGKSTFVRALQKHFISYNFPLDGWHTKYVNGLYELIVWNEWDIKLMSKSDLLLFTEGEIVDLKVKYTKAVKKDRPLILFTANESYKAQVHRRYAYDPKQRDLVKASLDVRIKEFNFTKPIWFLTKLLVCTSEDI